MNVVWRHVLEETKVVDEIGIALGKCNLSQSFLDVHLKFQS